ncbi:MAG: 23S rRNA (uracil(1939)-C(5))-methyltransferase RlmD [Gammaproteobacteria bacterium]|nr:MAG: 23S rRNA (uracil(1939)-C(5))-methyltransferase RlmD [Gammaproteobacteria bacterium]
MSGGSGAPRRGDLLELDVEDLTHDGQGVARHQGKVVFVDGALPGERVQARLRRRRRQFDQADLLTVLRASPDRVEPRCAHFGVCGGCCLQHLRPEAQRAAKERQLAEVLQRIGGVAPERWLAPLEGDIWAYRAKARLGVRYVPGKGRTLVGFRERGRPYITDTRRCEVLVEPLGGLVGALAELIDGLSIRDRLPQIEVAQGDGTTALVFRVLEPPAMPDRARLVEFARRHGLVVYLQPGGADSLQPLWPESPPELAYRLPNWDVSIHFSPLDFTQVNPSVNRRMVAQALDLLEPAPGETVLDLFCGLGNFSLPAARLGARVIGIEGEAGMVERARANAARHGLEAAFYTADLFEPPPTPFWWGEGRSIDKVLLDPPRSGAETVCGWLPRLGAKRIVYVSCNPATLARDARKLVEGGYRLEAAGLLNMFPHTAHSEAMALFSR